MTSALVPFTFNSIKLFTVTINGKHWTRAREVCRGMEYDKKTTKTADVVKYHCSRENYAHKYELMKFVQQTNFAKDMFYNFFDRVIKYSVRDEYITKEMEDEIIKSSVLEKY